MILLMSGSKKINNDTVDFTVFISQFSELIFQFVCCSFFIFEVRLIISGLMLFSV